MFEQTLNPTGHMWLTILVALIPLAALILMLAVFRVTAWLATILAGNAPMAMRGMKRAINEFARGKLNEEAADRRARDSMRSAEIKEGIAAFAEKRPPKF